MIIRMHFVNSLVILALVQGHCLAACPTDWTTRSGMCYFSASARVSWSMARSSCQTMGGELVSFADADERDYIYNTFVINTGNKFWVGLNDVTIESQFEWSDGTLYDPNIALWKLGQPDNGRDTGDSTVQEDCVAINDESGNDNSQGTWDDNQCDKSRSYICKKSDQDVPDCDESAGFEKHGQYCYRMVEEQSNWQTAEKTCQDAWHAELTAVTSNEEQAVLTDMMMKVNTDVWIGLSDVTTPGTLQWSNGHDRLTYTNWADGEPALKGNGGSCAQSSVLAAGKWNIMDCGEQKPFVCRKGLRAVCPDGWYYGHGKCYELVLNPNFFRTWTQAYKYCNAKNARLLEIENDDEQLFIASFATELYKEGILQVWLGISDIGHDQTLTWVDQSPVAYNQWDGSQSPTLGQDDCAQFYAGKSLGNWELVTCYSEQSFICEINEGTPLSDIEVPDEVYYQCPINWRLHPPYCYLFSEDKMNFADSEDYCVSRAAHLASVHNGDQQSFIVGHIKGFSWLGGNDQYREGVFQWTDNTPWNFTNWKVANEPQPNSDGDCLRLIGSNDDNALGQWNDWNCGELQYIICKVQAVHLLTPKPVPTLPPNANDLLCGSGYIHNPSTHKCYKFVDKFSRTWQDARINCLAEGADLASVNTPDEQSFLEGNAALASNQLALWLGATDSKSGVISAPVVDLNDGGWRWTDGSPFNFINWNAGEPNNVNNEDCIEMQVYGGRWNDLKCTDFRGYICEKEDPDHATDPPINDCKGVDCCYGHIGVEKGGVIKNRQLSASSQRDDKSGPDRGRLNTYDQYIAFFDIGPGTGGWIADENQGGTPWIQVDLEQFYEVRGVVTQGLNGLSQPVNQNMWTKTISVQYKTHKVKDDWQPIRDSLGNKIIFDANTDQNTQITNVFPRPVLATGIRIYLETCRMRCAMRFEVLGCMPQCDDSLVIQPNGVYPDLPDSSYSASTMISNNGPEKSKLDYTESAGSSGCWKPTSSDTNQWIQIDLGEPRKVSGVMMQGNPAASEWVTEYLFQFSNDGGGFTTYLNTDGSNQVFPANTDQNTVNEGFLREPITTRFVRVAPVTWKSAIALRFDVIGCRNDDLVTCSDTAEARPDSFTVDCPAGCDLTAATVYGTEVYAQQSSICAAAVHDGRILVDHGGTVDVNKIIGKSSYTGSYANGVQSQNYANSEYSFTFQGDHLGCMNGWHGWQNWCYYTPRHSTGLNWADSRDYCQRQGGDLASVHSQAEQDFVSTLIFFQYTLTDCWLGMNDLDQLNYYQWSDGTDVTFTAWKPQAPDGQHERCIEVFRTSGMWNDAPCDGPNNLVCKMDKFPVNEKQTAVEGCETGWIAYEGSCYFIDLTRMVWINAENYCKGIGGHLTAINNINEQMFLLSQISEATHSSDDEKFWIGLGAYIKSNIDSLDYKWTTDEPVTFTAWDKNQPNIKHTCSFPFLYNGVEYYNCIEEGPPYDLVGPWCSADPVYTNHFVACNGWSDSQVGCFRMDSVTGLWSQGQPFACGSDAYKICEKPRIGYTNPPPPTTPSPNGNCPIGWHGSAKSSYCYQVNEVAAADRLTWAQADANCRSQGAQLASMHSYQEEDIIASAVRHTSGNDFFWIGLKRVNGGTYSWTDGTPLSYTNWQPSEPNNHQGRENCVEMNVPDASNGWNDMVCESYQNWICKILRGTELLPPVTLPTAQPSYECGADKKWYLYTDTNGMQHCYTLATEVLGYYNARQKCKEMGGNLASIHSMEEQAFLTGLTSKIDLASFWIGLVQDGYGGYYVWVDGTTLAFVNWWAGEPNDHNGQESCVQMSNLYGLWNDDNCGRTHGYVCKKAFGATPGTVAPTPTLPGGCPENWSLYGSKCFLFVGWTDTSVRKTWQDAEAYCNEQGGYLASVPNQYYNAYLQSQMYQLHTNAWIGLSTIGGNREFLWTDNEAVTYTNWAANEPNDQGTEECVEMFYTSGRWNDKACSEARPFVCNSLRTLQYPQPSDETTGCPSGYIRWDTSCYKIYSSPSEQMSWQEARDKCRADGSQYRMTIELVSVWNAFENAFLKSMFWPEANYDHAWIGLYYNHTQTNGETQFLWADGSAVYYTNWDTNQPQDTQSSTGCIMMRDYGTWSLVDANECNLKRPFVCKYEELTFPTQSPGLGMCDPDWVAFGDYCYYIKPGIDNPVLSWGDAENACNTRGGNLASIHSDLENKAIDSWVASQNVWLGLKRNAWGGWGWSDLSALDFTKWNDGEPNDFGETGEQCTEMYRDGVWNDAVCSEMIGYVCKKHKSYSSCAFPSAERTDCGYDGISEYECLGRLCCWDTTGSAAVNCYYSRDDAQCLDKGGQCKDYQHVNCELGYEQSLCSGGSGNRCCFTCGDNDETCQNEVNGWEENDDLCENNPDIAGKCQYNSNYCNGDYLTGLCGGPGQRQCCTPKTAPPVTQPKTTVTPKTQSTDDTGNTQTPPKTQTAKMTTTSKIGVTDFISNSSGGLSGGAIAGIVISVLFLVAGLGLAFYYQRTGSLPSPSNLSRSIPFMKKSTAAPAGGFDNPISYVKESGDDGNLDLGGTSNA